MLDIASFLEQNYVFVVASAALHIFKDSKPNCNDTITMERCTVAV